MPKKAPTHSERQKRPPDSRRNRSGLYNTARWKRLRKLRLKREPLCRACKEDDLIKAAEEVDHIKPHKNDIRLFFSYDNTQSLCHSCHSRKTATEEGAFGK